MQGRELEGILRSKKMCSTATVSEKNNCPNWTLLYHLLTKILHEYLAE